MFLNWPQDLRLWRIRTNVREIFSINMLTFVGTFTKHSLVQNNFFGVFWSKSGTLRFPSLWFPSLNFHSFSLPSPSFPYTHAQYTWFILDTTLVCGDTKWVAAVPPPVLVYHSWANFCFLHALFKRFLHLFVKSLAFMLVFAWFWDFSGSKFCLCYFVNFFHLCTSNHCQTYKNLQKINEIIDKTKRNAWNVF